MSYLSKGADNGALYDPSEEDEVNIFSSCAGWQVFQVVQYLLHGYVGITNFRMICDKESARNILNENC